MHRVELESLAEATRLINHGPCVLVSVGDKERDNLFTVAWNMPIRKSPPMVAIESGKSHFSYPLIERTGEFAINVPSADIAHKVLAAGRVSGKDVDDKFSHVGLHRERAAYIKAPLVAETVASLECKVSQMVDFGSSVLIVAQVLRAVVDVDSFEKGTWRFDNGLRLLHHLGGNSFSASDERIDF